MLSNVMDGRKHLNLDLFRMLSTVFVLYDHHYLKKLGKESTKGIITN